MSVPPDILKQWLLLVQEMNLPERRAAELAVEVEQLSNAVRQASKRLDFDSEPTSFLVTLGAFAQRKEKDGS